MDYMGEAKVKSITQMGTFSLRVGWEPAKAYEIAKLQIKITDLPADECLE
jgi:hypothetical protein